VIQETYLEAGSPKGANAKRGGTAAVALLLLGLYFPTSMGANFSKILLGSLFGLCLGIFVVLVLRTKNAASFSACLSAALIVPLLLVFTATSSLHSQAWGALVLYGTLAAMFMLNLRDVYLPPWAEHVFAAVNILNIVLSVAILFGVQSVDHFIIQFYTFSDVYVDLVPNMLLLRKPVLSFGTHSLAGFFLYLFFYVNWQAYRLRGRKLFLIFALSNLFLTASLLSVTGVTLAMVGSLQVLYHLWSAVRLKWLWLLGLATIAIMCMAFPFGNSAVKNLGETAQGVSALLTSTGGGFGGRLLPGGTLYDDIQYIKAHPFSPTGVGNSEGLLFVDSGWVEYTLRGSVIFVLLIYSNLYFFLTRSLLAKTHRYWLFLVILAFELGFTSLTYYRTLYLLPFFIVFLNGLHRTQDHSPLTGSIVPLKDGALH
jgi:hypothetical protein